MINAIGIAVILSYDFTKQEDFQIKHNNALVEPISSRKMINYEGKPVLEITCKYSILMDEDTECKTINDYAGKISPFLRSIVGLGLVRTENYHLHHVDKPTKHIKEIIEELLEQ
ncbi:cytoplasmic protein [Bacillus toyonensis]|uniref:cytoplasmic protein n=1 Tax=Bacillus toyonensis TaxID=155322 RepID=UPI000BF9998E|nr:cytoplasmic protein [Bacillus toyonensis]PGC13805.1 cytoplasmic protein [Bacillus toyonensis]PGC85242.1 cytoplasmic protein [Bacillus toyonensis]